MKCIYPIKAHLKKPQKLTMKKFRRRVWSFFQSFVRSNYRVGSTYSPQLAQAARHHFTENEFIKKSPTIFGG